MKKSIFRVFSLILIFTLLATSGALAFTFKEIFYSPREIEEYRKAFWEEVDRMGISETEFQNMVPAFDKFVFITDPYADDNPQYAVKLEALPGYEEFLEKENYPGYKSVYLYTSPTEDGEYTESGSAIFQLGGYEFVDGCAIFDYLNLEGKKYAKIRYSNKGVYSDFSDPVKIPVKPASKPYVALYKISSAELFAVVSDERNETRTLQIREKGTTKWYSVSQSPLVKSYEVSNRGYYLKVNPSKEYEVRARNFRKTNGKKYYGEYTNAKEYANAKAKAEDVSFLRYDKNSYVLTVTEWSNLERNDYDYDVQVAYRKTGTSKWFYTTTAIEYDTDLYRRGWSMQAKNGYEYKFRVYAPLPDNKKACGPWSKVFKCTKKSSAFVNEASIRDTADDHIYYDHNLSFDENYERIEWRVPEVCIYRLSRNGLVMNDELYGHTVRIDCSREDEGFAGVHVFGDWHWEPILEILCFYAEDNEIAYGLLGWWKASCSYGHANSDYFGFKDVKSTKNGFIIEMNGQQIEVEKTEKGTIYWFNLND